MIDISARATGKEARAIQDFCDGIARVGMLELSRVKLRLGISVRTRGLNAA